MSIISFLRYNSRHGLYWHPTYEGGGLKLNPISSMYDGAQKTWDEPLWLFRLRQRLFAHAGKQRCGRRDDPFSMNRNDSDLPDTWDWGPDGCRTCSYCGSAHPDDLIRICRLTLEDERYGVEGTDKSYKVYLKQPGVCNASEGAIKFYMQHAPKEPTAEEQELFTKARRKTNERFNAWMALPLEERYPNRKPAA